MRLTMGLVKSAVQMRAELAASGGERRYIPSNHELVDAIMADGRERVPALLSIGEVIHHYKTNRKVIDMLIKTGKLQYRRTPGGHRRFHEDDLNMVLERK
jgi:hypothetical protein